MIEEISIESLTGRGSITMKTRDADGYWLGAVDWGQVQGQNQTYRYYNQVGESIVSTSLLSRPLSIEGWVIEGERESLRQRCDRLNAFFSPAEDYSLRYQDKKIRFRPDRSIVYGRAFRENNRQIRKFLLQAVCPYPLFSDAQDKEKAFQDTEKLFRFPTDFGQGQRVVFAASRKAYQMNLTNAGGFPTGLKLRVRFSGPVQNLRLRNKTSGEFIGVNRLFAKGEQLLLSTLPGEKAIELLTPEGQRQNLIKYRDWRTSWIQLAPGDNQLALECDDLDQRNNMEVAVSFTPLYLEVE